MGFKVNLFLAFCLGSGYLFDNFQMKALFVNLAWFTLIYMKFKIWRFTSQFPGGGVASISRNLFHTAASFHRELSEMSAKFGDKFITWVGVERFVVVSKLSDVQAVLGVTQDASLMANYQQMWPWLGGDDVIKAEGFSAEHLVAALVQGPFRQLTQSNAFIKSLNKRIEAMCQHVIDGDVIDVQPMIRSMTFDVVFGLAVGGAPSTSERRELFEAGEKLCQMADQQTYSGWKQNKWLTNVLGEQSRVEKLRSVLARSVRRALSSRRDESGREVSCLLDALAATKALSEDEIASTIVGFIVLGYDRLASGSCLAILELSKQPSTQQIIRKETKQLQTHKALESFLLETQRLYPVTSCIAKWITEGVPLAGFFIPPNASVFVYLQGIGRDAQRFETPEKFDMQRANLMDTFGGENYEHNLPTTLMKALVGNLLEKFQLTAADKTSTKLGSGLSLRPREVRVAVASQ